MAENIFKFQKGWNNFTFILKPNKFFGQHEFGVINTDGTMKIFKVPGFECDCDVTEMVFFNNFIGQASTIMYLNKAINEESLKVLKEFPYGFFSEKKINGFLKLGNNNFLN